MLSNLKEVLTFKITGNHFRIFQRPMKRFRKRSDANSSPKVNPSFALTPSAVDFNSVDNRSLTI